MTIRRLATLAALLFLPAALLCQAVGAAPPPEHLITIGQVMSGSLAATDARTADGTYAQAWRIVGVAGRVITVDLASSEFDAFLLIQGPGIDSSRVLQDDDSGGHCNARVAFAFPDSGEYVIIVTTSIPRATGAFTLAVRAGAIPASLAPCHRP